MSVYVDNMQAPMGRMVMCHMVADTHRELLEMADKLGLDRRHIQNAGTASEHFDVSKGYRAQAVALGAVEVTQWDIVRMIRTRRLQGVTGENEYFERISAEL